MIKFEAVSERDIDLMIMRAFSTLSPISSLFFERANRHCKRVISIEHSLTHPKLGESDITVIFEDGGRKYAFLIEDKINAGQMPDQYERYIERGGIGIKNGDYYDYNVFMAAPEQYLNALPPQDGYLQVSFEDMLCKAQASGSEFDISLLNAALDCSVRPYHVRDVPQITQFWHDMYNYVHASECHTTMFPVKTPKGSRSGWFQFKTFLPKTALYFKSDRGYVDFELSKASYGKDLPLTVPDVNLPREIHWAETGKSWSLRIRVEPVNVLEPFKAQTDRIDLALAAVTRLYDFSTIFLPCVPNS